ncbi:hypothetical protein C0216_13245 [Streptomyces globosus]|uniref:Uncharacterized protein n=1 Tax=Streptomyces globosus TaxID=68209 RepID=A0A344U073_9ACTN|nr:MULTISPECIES: hypothetical protein [Streptomyces]AXE24294.1 hypothetical protein C0216_13245 [Streptomyces globosus]
MVIIEAADEVLPGDACGQRLLFTTLLREGRRWSSRQPQGGERSRLVVTMSRDAASVPSLKERLRSHLPEAHHPG